MFLRYLASVSLPPGNFMEKQHDFPWASHVLTVSLCTQIWENNPGLTIGILFISSKRWDTWLKLLGKRGSLSTLLQCWYDQKQNKTKNPKTLSYYWAKQHGRKWNRGRETSVSDITRAQVPTLPVGRFNMDLSVTWNCWVLFVGLNQF